MRACILLGMVASARADVAPPVTFAPSVVGKLVPSPPVAGDYAMSLAMSFEEFVTTELRIDERVRGVLRLTLAADGSARACLGSHASHVSEGQYHYEPDPAKRQRHASEELRLVALRGHWQVTGTVATLRFDESSWGSCDLAKAQKSEAAVELRCVGVGTGDRLPAGSLVCEATERSELFGLGMPMGEANHNQSRRRMPPAGRHVLLGAPGLMIDVRQGSHDARPTFTFRAGAVTLVERDYQPRK